MPGFARLRVSRGREKEKDKGNENRWSKMMLKIATDDTKAAKVLEVYTF